MPPKVVSGCDVGHTIQVCSAPATINRHLTSKVFQSGPNRVSDPRLEVHFFLTSKLAPNRKAENIVIVGPAVESLNRNALSRNPAVTDRALAAAARRTKLVNLSASCRAVAAGIMIRAAG